MIENRKALYTKFRSGDQYNPEDIDYLLKTSELLNSCINHSAVNEMLKLIDRDKILLMEITLAESIIA
jgi:hypothetical protein